MFDPVMIGYRSLAAKIITTAWEDAQGGDEEARQFLKSEWTSTVADLLDMDYSQIAAKVDRAALDPGVRLVIHR